MQAMRSALQDALEAVHQPCAKCAAAAPAPDPAVCAAQTLELAEKQEVCALWFSGRDLFGARQSLTRVQILQLLNQSRAKVLALQRAMQESADRCAVCEREVFFAVFFWF